MKLKIILASVFILMCGVVLSQSQPEFAEVLLNKAYKQAAKEKKNVFVIFHASWCGWCKKLEASINDPSCKDYFDKSFIFVHLTI
jgi:thioredoxin-related protein